jgi:hypothetical protein
LIGKGKTAHHCKKMQSVCFWTVSRQTSPVDDTGDGDGETNAKSDVLQTG